MNKFHDYLISFRAEIDKVTLFENSTLDMAIRNLDFSGLQIILVISPEKRFIGTITDGDIRRGLLRGLNLESSINSIIHHDAIVVSPNINQDQMIQFMRINSIKALPVVNEMREIVDLYLVNESSSLIEKANPFIIMVGGKGTRLLPHTENCPKSMVLVSGKPMLEHIIEKAKSLGFKNFFLAINHLGHMIENYFGDGAKWDVTITYIRETQPLGTAGAITLLNPQPEIPILVTNGDVISDINYSDFLDFHLRCKADATMAVKVHEWSHPFGVVKTKGIDIIGYEEKPTIKTYINAGVYVLSPSIIKSLIFNNSYDMPEIFELGQLDSKKTVVYPIHEAWLDVGRPDDLMHINNKSG